MNNTRKACIKTYCQKEFPKRQKAFANKLLSALKVPKTKRAKVNSEVNKAKKTDQETCAAAYCNPTCEGTIFQSGKEHPQGLINKVRRNHPNTSKKMKAFGNALISLQRNTRKQNFRKEDECSKERIL